jgi:hypothetical protein
MVRLTLLSILLAARVLAADAEAAIRTTLVEPWLQAIRTNDKAGLTRFLHPRVRACINDRTREFFEYGDLLKPEGLTPQHRITKLKPLSGPGNLFGLPEDAFAYPVQPAYELTLEASQGDAQITQIVQIIRYLAPAGGSWYFVEPCPNEKGLALFHESLAKGAEQKQQVALLVAQLKDPLLIELKDLLKQHRKIDAVKKYQQATGQELTLSVMVMNALEKGNR